MTQSIGFTKGNVNEQYHDTKNRPLMILQFENGVSEERFTH